MTERRLDLCRRIMEHLAAVAEYADDPMLRLRYEAAAARLEEATHRGEGWQDIGAVILTASIREQLEHVHAELTNAEARGDTEAVERLAPRWHSLLAQYQVEEEGAAGV